MSKLITLDEVMAVIRAQTPEQNAALLKQLRKASAKLENYNQNKRKNNAVK